MSRKRYPAMLTAPQFREMVASYERRALRRAHNAEEVELVRTLAVVALAGFQTRRPPPPLKFNKTAGRVLEAFRAHGPITTRAAAVLPELAGLAPSTVYGRVSWLVKHGYLHDTGGREGTGWRARRIVYAVTPLGPDPDVTVIRLTPDADG